MSLAAFIKRREQIFVLAILARSALSDSNPHEGGLLGSIRLGSYWQSHQQVKGLVDQHWKRLRNDLFRAERRPIGSGTVESAARNVVTWRMKRGGQRWSQPGATRMLAALGEVHSDRWDTTLQRFAKAA